MIHPLQLKSLPLSLDGNIFVHLGRAKKGELRNGTQEIAHLESEIRVKISTKGVRVPRVCKNYRDKKKG